MNTASHSIVVLLIQRPRGFVRISAHHSAAPQRWWTVVSRVQSWAVRSYTHRVPSRTAPFLHPSGGSHDSEFVGSQSCGRSRSQCAMSQLQTRISIAVDSGSPMSGNHFEHSGSGPRMLGTIVSIAATNAQHAKSGLPVQHRHSS